MRIVFKINRLRSVCTYHCYAFYWKLIFADFLNFDGHQQHFYFMDLEGNQIVIQGRSFYIKVDQDCFSSTIKSGGNWPDYIRPLATMVSKLHFSFSKPVSLHSLVNFLSKYLCQIVRFRFIYLKWHHRKRKKFILIHVNEIT